MSTMYRRANSITFIQILACIICALPFTAQANGAMTVNGMIMADELAVFGQNCSGLTNGGN